MATRGKKVEIYYTSQGTTTGVDSSALLFDGKNLAIITHGKTFKGTDTWEAATTSQEGYVPQLASGGGSIATQASEYVLTYKDGVDSTPTWKLLPTNAFLDTNDDTWIAADVNNAGYVPHSVKGKYLHANDSTGALEWVDDHTYTVNNNTFSIKSLVGSTTTTLSDFTANQGSDDDFTLVQGSNITFTVDATNRKLTIAGTANTWQAANASQEGYVPKTTANKILRSNNDGALYWGDDTNTWRPVGTGATDAAAGNHTHGISIAADSGTNQISLAAGTKYKLTAGGQSYIFTTPSDNNTDTKVSQVDNNDNAARPILVKNGTSTGTVTDSALFADGVTVNPSSNSLSISGNLSVSGTASFSNNVTLSGVITFATNDSYGLAATANYSQIGFSDRYFWKGHINNFYANTISSLNESGAPNFPNGLTSGGNAVIHSGNIGSQSVSYATSTGNADTVDNFHASNLAKFYLSPMSSGAPADSAKSWFTGTMPSSTGAIVYNVPGSEKTIIAGKSSGAYGHMLQLNYDDTYLRILRYARGSWRSTDWEKISAGYADSAGSANSVSWSNVTGKPSTFEPSSHTHSEFVGTAAMTNLVVSNDNSQTSYDALAYFRHYSSNDWTVKIDDGGRDFGLYITNSGSNACKIDGNLTCTNAYATSDRHLKKGIKNISISSLERLFDISDKLLKQFTWKQTGKDSYGFIAQELEQYIPEAVETSDVDGYKSVNYEVAYAKILAMVIYKLKTLTQ